MEELKYMLEPYKVVIRSQSLEEHETAGNEISSLASKLDAFCKGRKIAALLQIVDTSLPGVAATRPNTARALWGRARPAGHPAARIAA